MAAKKQAARVRYTLLNMRVMAPFDTDFVAELKSGIASRKWEPKDKEWVINLRERKEAIEILRKFYDPITEENSPPGEQQKKKRERRRQSTNKASFVGVATTSEYADLHLLPNAPPELIRSAYRTLSKLYHPDTNKISGSEEKMKTINRAYEIIMKKNQT